MKLSFTHLAVAAIFAATGPSFASDTSDVNAIEVQLVEDIGAAERVEAAALLRVLSQEAASAACHLGTDIKPKEARVLMLEAKTRFGTLLDALQYGNPDLGIIGEEKRKKTILKIEAVRAAWAPVYDGAVTLLQDPHNAEALKIVKAENEAVLAAASLLTSEIAGEYSNPAEMLQTDVMLLDFSARQAMLTQKMGKISCEISAGNRSDDRIELLTRTMQTYDLTLNALLNGMPEAGIQAAPTEEIRAALSHATESWTKIKSELDMVLAGDNVTHEIKETLFHDLNAAMYEMEHIEHLYVVHSKHDYDKEPSTGTGSL